MLRNKKAAIIAKIFQDKRNMQFFRSLLSIRSLIVKAFIEKLFLGVIESRYPSIIQECLNIGVDPNLQLLGQTAL